ncbi:hypothetical protein [Streptomyces sp. CS227]|uniref:hypothetical protein n=1 Tax=Streptomyces sp. CS227 TaxID=1982763 RepID=UPI00211B2526|nr:hypothetical protein [Streptomyces sp. CS227]
MQGPVIREATANMRVLSTELLADNLEADDAAGEAARRAAAARVQETKRAEFHSLDLVLGLRIEDSPILPPGPGSAQADARLPRLFLPDGRSLYDLLGDGLTLLAPCGATPQPWSTPPGCGPCRSPWWSRRRRRGHRARPCSWSDRTRSSAGPGRRRHPTPSP